MSIESNIDSNPTGMCAAGAALVDQIVGRKAYQHHCSNALMITLAIAQFVVTGLLPLSADTFFIMGESLGSFLTPSMLTMDKSHKCDFEIVPGVMFFCKSVLPAIAMQYVMLEVRHYLLPKSCSEVHESKACAEHKETMNL